MNKSNIDIFLSRVPHAKLKALIALEIRLPCGAVADPGRHLVGVLPLVALSLDIGSRPYVPWLYVKVRPTFVVVPQGYGGFGVVGSMSIPAGHVLWPLGILRGEGVPHCQG